MNTCYFTRTDFRGEDVSCMAVTPVDLNNNESIVSDLLVCQTTQESDSMIQNAAH